jgi:NAD(P)-dependent dehydrogenase (short-subunit alcohol dehydrogenase family)
MSKRFFLDKVAIVTGASDGIGRATALALARQGACVAISARREAQLERVAHEIKEYGRDAQVVIADVTVISQVERLVGEVMERWGQIDILVSNAGEYVRAPVKSLTLPVLQHSMAVNFYGGIHAILAVLPHMRQRNSGHIVVVTSMNGKKGMPMDAPYAAAKFALTGFVEVLRQELYGSGIFVSNILPGRVDTEMIRNLKVPWISAKIAPEAVARAILIAIEKHKPEVILPPLAIGLHYINVLSPRMGDAIARFFHLEGWEM